MAATVYPVRRRRGVRRGREENAAAAEVEIEELDSDVMRQNTYNYFQQQGARLDLRESANAGAGAATPVIQLDAGVSSRKRQRTLAEQLEDLCLHPGGGGGTTATSSKSGSSMSGAAAAAACRQAWNRVFAAQMAAQQQRAANAKAKANATAAAAAAATTSTAATATTTVTDVGTAPVVAPIAVADVEMDTNAASDTEDDNDDGLRVVGAVPDVKGLFFNTSSSGGRQRPMERMFHHYVTMAEERSAQNSTTSTNTPPRGDEIVLFQPGPTSMEFPYSLFTPEQIEDLRARHNRKKKRQASNSRSPLGSVGAARDTRLENTTWRFQEIDSSDEADVSSSADDSDMDMSADGEATAGPQLAGSLSHGEWFVEGDDDDDDDNDGDDGDDDL